ncbi:hypothetical protein NQF87_03205 [Bombella sp. TMW 2.2559]|uniref:Uncharacterized protein n=1 Tax=Bombella dulcis TaxID=2967339 RepID=A0ABT3WA64_9PROT|nr:hypothetical protein [Bombella dulcis]MCX5615987.1 hypothetical protein [Bombella dulcis]
MSEGRQRLWIMDWFGHIITQPKEGDALQRHQLRAGDYPDTYIMEEWPLKLPASVVFQYASSRAKGLPDVSVVEAGESVFGFVDKDTGTFFSIDPRNHDTHWNSVELYDWERFILLTKEMLDGIFLLQDRSYGEVKMNGVPAPVLVWPSVAENVGNFAWLGGFAFSISRNLRNFAKIGQAPVGSSVEVALVSSFGDVARLVINRSQKTFD